MLGTLHTAFIVEQYKHEHAIYYELAPAINIGAAPILTMLSISTSLPYLDGRCWHGPCQALDGCTQQEQISLAALLQLYRHTPELSSMCFSEARAQRASNANGSHISSDSDYSVPDDDQNPTFIILQHHRIRFP
jgi:hypothetical protein